jgi:cell wall-associated NlpC family hydrolase
MVEAARSAIGRPYQAASAGPDGFDCSGLIVWAAAEAGITGVPRSSFAQYEIGTEVTGDIQAGDLVFFDTGGPGASDVGIASGPDTVISATTHGVREHPLSGPYWGDHFVGARRLD